MSKQSENMMDLLKELALLKELDRTSNNASHTGEEVKARQNRRQEITDQITALGEATS